MKRSLVEQHGFAAILCIAATMSLSMIGCNLIGGCTEMGCNDSIQVSMGLPADALSSSALPLTIEMCLDGRVCDSMTVDATPGGEVTCTPMSGALITSCFRAPDGSIVFTRALDGAEETDPGTWHAIDVTMHDAQNTILLERTQWVEGKLFYANGEGCPGECYQLSATFEP